jgi:hypothetical protein
MPKTSTEVDLPLSAQLTRALAGEEILTTDNAEEVQARIVAQILASDTVEQVFDNEGTTATMKMIGEIVVLRDVALRPSQIQAIPGQPPPSLVYAILEVGVPATGEIKILNTGSPRIMAQACKAKDLGALPLEVRVVEVGRAKPGMNAPLGLELVA